MEQEDRGGEEKEKEEKKRGGGGGRKRGNSIQRGIEKGKKARVGREDMSQSRRRGWGGDSRVCTSVCCHVCRTRHEAFFSSITN